MKKVNIHGQLVEKKVRIKIHQTQLVVTGHSSLLAVQKDKLIRDG